MRGTVSPPMIVVVEARANTIEQVVKERRKLRTNDESVDEDDELVQMNESCVW